MSFSGEVKQELKQTMDRARHCRIAEITAIITLCGGVAISSSERMRIRIRTENPYVAGKFCTLVSGTFQAHCEVQVSRRRRSGRETAPTYLAVTSAQDSERILQACRLMDADGRLRESESLVDETIVQQRCCRRAFLRGAFLSAGSVSDPAHYYHYEITCTQAAWAGDLMKLMETFEMTPRMTMRKDRYVIYLKEGSQIADMLRIMEAPSSLMKFENIRILRDISNHVNRAVNCETANLTKTIDASVRQVEDIQYLLDHGYLQHLSAGLQQTARLRLEYPDLPLAQLAALHDPPVGKSGVNHRLNKLGELAGRYREEAPGAV